jgi:hypothetical protein
MTDRKHQGMMGTRQSEGGRGERPPTLQHPSLEPLDMAISTVAQVRTFSNSIGSCRLLLFVIASHISPVTDTAWPSVPTLANETKLSIRHVYRLLRRLETMGEIVIYRTPGRVNRYRVKLSPAPDTQESDAHQTPASPTSEPLPPVPAESRVKEDIALSRLNTWLTPGSRIYQLMTSG